MGDTLAEIAERFSPPPTRKQCNSPGCDFSVRPTLNKLRPDAQEQMHMIDHHGECEHIDRAVGRQEFHSRSKPRAPTRVCEKRLLSNASREAVIEAGVSSVDNVRSTLGHVIKLPRRGAHSLSHDSHAASSVKFLHSVHRTNCVMDTIPYRVMHVCQS